AEEYTTRQLDTLCDLVEGQRSRFSVSHWLVLLRLQDRPRRDKLMTRAVRASWSKSELKRAVQAERGERRPNVGRKPTVPDDPRECLIALDAQADKWCRWCDASRPLLPAELGDDLLKAVKAVRKVQAAAATYRKAESE